MLDTWKALKPPVLQLYLKLTNLGFLNLEPKHWYILSGLERFRQKKLAKKEQQGIIFGEYQVERDYSLYREI